MKYILEIDLDHQDAQKYGSLASILQSAASHFITDIDDWSAKPQVGEHGGVQALHGVVGKWRIVASEKAYLCDFCRDFETDSADELEDHWHVCPFNDENKDPRDLLLDQYVEYVHAEVAQGNNPITFDRWRQTIQDVEDRYAGLTETVYATPEAAAEARHEEEQERKIAEHEASLPADDETGDLPLGYDNDDQP